METQLLVLIIIGVIAGSIVGGVIFFGEGSFARIWISIAAGIFGSIIGSSVIGQDFLLDIFRVMILALQKLIEASKQILLSGIVLIPTFVLGVLFAFAFSLVAKYLFPKE